MHSKPHAPSLHSNPSVPCITFIAWAFVRASPWTHWEKGEGLQHLPDFQCLTFVSNSMNVWCQKICYLDYWYFEYFVTFLFWNILFKNISFFLASQENMVAILPIFLDLKKMQADDFFLWRHSRKQKGASILWNIILPWQL